MMEKEIPVAITIPTNIVAFIPKNGKKKPAVRIPASLVSPNIQPAPAGSGGVTNAEELGETKDEHDEEKRRQVINTICSGIMHEVYFKLANMGYDVHSEQFEKDLEFAQEAIHSAVLRTFGVFHPIQEFIDENFELVTVEDFVLPPPAANT